MPCTAHFENTESTMQGGEQEDCMTDRAQLHKQICQNVGQLRETLKNTPIDQRGEDYFFDRMLVSAYDCAKHEYEEWEKTAPEK